MNGSAPLPRVGFVGLGVMGRPMASHLSRAGCSLQLFDIAPGLATDLAAALPNAVAATSPAALAAASDIVVTMVPNGEVVRSLVVGDEGLLNGFAPGALLLDTSSSEPWLTEDTAKTLAGRGVAMVDAPVSGAEWGARRPSWCSWSAERPPTSSGCGRCSRRWARRCSTSAASARAMR
jgi:3-hydroxyisobutyrate dehydrogenase